MQHLLLLHGAIGASDQLKPLADALSGTFHVHTLNFPGHGGQQLTGEFSIAGFAAFTEQYITANQLIDVAIFGYSMGGYVALYLALKYPGRISRIATLATKFHWDETTAAREVRMLDPEKMLEKVPAFTTALEKRHAPGNWKQLLAATRNMMLAMGAGNPLSVSGYAAIDTPVLLMLGDRDKMVSLDETLAVYHALPNSQMAMLPATPHPIEQVDTAALAFLLSAFFLPVS